MPRVVRARSGVAELRLEPRQPAADHRLRHAEPRPGAGQAAAVGHLGEGADVVEVRHRGVPLSAKVFGRLCGYRRGSCNGIFAGSRTHRSPRKERAAMNTILVIDSAVSGEASVSRTLVREAVAALTAGDAARVVHRDLGAEPVPHLTEANARRRPRHPRDRGRARRPRPLRRADRRAPRRRHHRDRRADVQLQRRDRPARRGSTTCCAPARPSATPRPAPRACSRASGSSSSRAAAASTARGRRRPSTSRSPTCATCSASWASTDVTFVRAEKIGYGPEARAAAIAAATAALQQVAAGDLAQAA